MLLIQLAKALEQVSTSQIFFTKVMPESWQNKKKITKLSKKEAGGDKKHVYICTWAKVHVS